VHHRLAAVQAYVANAEVSRVTQKVTHHGPWELFSGHELIDAVQASLAAQIAGCRQGYKDAPGVRLRQNRERGDNSMLRPVNGFIDFI
jgi:hypothetical protein